MIEILLPQCLAIAAMATIAILIVVFGYKEYRLRKKVELLTHIVDKGYEHENVPLNNSV